MPIPLLVHGRHASAGVTYQPFGPWIVPWRFSSTAVEYAGLTTAAGLIDYSILSHIEVAGEDRLAFLHSLLSNDIKRLAPGQGCQAALLSPNAKLIATLIVLAEASSVRLLCDATVAAIMASALERYVFSERVTIVNHERREAILALQGPRTIACLTQILGTVVSLPDPEDHTTVSFDGASMRVIRHDLTAAGGVLCSVNAEAAAGVWQRLRERGLPHGLQLVGWETLNIARIEAGIPWFGIDMDDSNLLPETGLETRLASDTKGCYIGQEIVARMQTYGSASKKLVGLRLEGTQVPAAGDPIVSGEEPVGQITSACHSPML